MVTTNRKDFLRKLLLGGACVVCSGGMLFQPNNLLLAGMFSPLSEKSSGKSVHGFSSLKEAMFYNVLARNRVICLLCPHQCILAAGETGLCRVRSNFSGKLYSMVYGRPCTYDIGPIEKAPLYHFFPGHRRLCVATVGCNLRCKYCHNWHISQTGPGRVREFEITPRQMVSEAFRRGVRSISFTYTEPTVFYEYMYDISRRAQSEGLKVSIVSNGYINPDPLRKLLPYIDAVKIDLKSFNDDFYFR